MKRAARVRLCSHASRSPLNAQDSWTYAGSVYRVFAGARLELYWSEEVVPYDERVQGLGGESRVMGGWVSQFAPARSDSSDGSITCKPSMGMRVRSVAFALPAESFSSLNTSATVTARSAKCRTLNLHRVCVGERQ